MHLILIAFSLAATGVKKPCALDLDRFPKTRQSLVDEKRLTEAEAQAAMIYDVRIETQPRWKRFVPLIRRSEFAHGLLILAPDRDPIVRRIVRRGRHAVYQDVEPRAGEVVNVWSDNEIQLRAKAQGWHWEAGSQLNAPPPRSDLTASEFERRFLQPVTKLIEDGQLRLSDITEGRIVFATLDGGRHVLLFPPGEPRVFAFREDPPAYVPRLVEDLPYGKYLILEGSKRRLFPRYTPEFQPTGKFDFTLPAGPAPQLVELVRDEGFRRFIENYADAINELLMDPRLPEHRKLESFKNVVATPATSEKDGEPYHVLEVPMPRDRKLILVFEVGTARWLRGPEYPQLILNMSDGRRVAWAKDSKYHLIAPAR